MAFLEDLETAIDIEYNIVCKTISMYSYLNENKIEFIRLFRERTGYTLDQSSYIVGIYLGYNSGSIFRYVKGLMIMQVLIIDNDDNNHVPNITTVH